MPAYEDAVVEYMRSNGVFLHADALWHFDASVGASAQVFPVVANPAVPHRSLVCKPQHKSRVHKKRPRSRPSTT
jgi:hypothetical protein